MRHHSATPDSDDGLIPPHSPPLQERLKGFIIIDDMREDIKNTKEAILSKIEFMDRKDLLRVINGAYIAERFFGKSSCWFSQKLNNHLKNGKPCEFTQAEIETLRNALYTISIEIQEIADELQ